MIELVRQLKELSEVDALVAEAKSQLVLYPKLMAKLHEDESALKKKAELARVKGEAARSERRAAEQEVASLREKIKKMLGQQGMVKTNKEMEALTHEIELLNAKVDGLDTRGLELLEAEEAAAKDVKDAELRHQRVVAENAPEKERMQGQIKDKQEKLERLSSEQSRRFAELPDDWQQDYELMNVRTPGSVAVQMEGGECGGCHMSLPPGTQHHVREGKMVVRCDNCRRVLFL